MAKLKLKDIERMSEKERKDKLNELKIELIKSQISANKSGSLRKVEIQKAIARILTFNRLNKRSIESK